LEGSRPAGSSAPAVRDDHRRSGASGDFTDFRESILPALKVLHDA
jgi:hypothetical protein